MLARGVVNRPRKLGGFHKTRVENPTRGKGKRGGFRVYYMPYDDLGVVVLALLSDKVVKSNISADEQKQLRLLAGRLRKEIEDYVQSAERKRPRGGSPRRR